MLRKTIVPILGIVIFILIWQTISIYVFPEKSILPSPISVGYALQEMWHSGELIEDVLASLNRILLGFVIALFTAIVFGITAARYGKIYDYIKVSMDLMSSIPPIAWTPLAILWFGIGNAPACFIVFLGAFFPMFTSIYSGITSVDTDLINAAKTLGASPSFIVKSVIFPAALPQILTGIRTGIGVAWFNVIAAELIGVRSGLGYKIQLNRTLLFSEHVIGIMFIIGILGFFMTRLVGILGNLTAPWVIQDATRPKWINHRRRFSHVFSTLRGLSSGKIRFKQSVNLEYNSFNKLSYNNKQKPVLVVDDVSISFPGQIPGERLEVLRNIAFNIKAHEVFSILGPNGSGKTTIIKIIAGLLKPDNGNVAFMGRQIYSPSCQRTVVFQNFALFPWQTCRENILFALKASACEISKKCKTSLERIELTTQLLKEANLDKFSDTYPIDLSGGMKQRLALARALAVSPELILMDEPFASFDPLVRVTTQETILELLANRSVTVLFVTHDLDEAIFMSDRILVLSERPGRIKNIVDVKLPRPRIADMRRSQAFNELRTYLWDLLRS